MVAAYKERQIIGGVYAVTNTRSGRKFVDATTDMRGSRNRFDFAQKTDMCTYKRIEKDWKESGASSFAFETLEEYEKDSAQTMEEFQSDIATLKELWLEKLTGCDVIS
jgi:hypothetical protein